MQCTLCGHKTVELTHLNLYVVGSEGIKVCLECRAALTDGARRIKLLCSRAHINGVKKGKGLK